MGARANAAKNGLNVVSETKYRLATTDFARVLREAQQSAPDILFLCSYLNDSVGLIRAIAESEIEPAAGRRGDDRPAEQRGPDPTRLR